MSNPADLNITPQPDTDKNFFNFKAVGLKINKTYAIKFQWIYDDLTLSDWSPGFFITTSNETAPAVPSSASVPGSATGSIPVTLSSFPTNAKRVDVVITNGIFGTATVAHSFTTVGTITIAAPAGSYIVQLRSISPTGVTSTVGTTFTITVADVGETIQAPTNPNGFSSKRILAGIEVSWSGTYANSTFTGFEAINVYAGNSATATSGTYEQVGVLTGNNVKNTIVVPVGTYVVYGQAVYIHAAAVNKSGAVGTIQANVTNQALGPGKATDADINDGAVSIPKLASNVLFVDSLKAGTLNATSYIRSGSKSGARIEISSATTNITTETDPITNVVSNLTYPVKPGITIYASNATTEIFRADYNGGLAITGSLAATSISTSSGKFAVNSGGVLTATDVNLTGEVTAASGSIGNWKINSGVLKSGTEAFPRVLLDPTNSQIILRDTQGASDLGQFIKLDPSVGIKVGTTALAKFSFAMNGNMSATDAVFNSGSFSGSITSSATITGGTITGATITSTNDPYFGAVKLNSSNSSFEVVGNNGAVYGQLYQFNNGNELILRHGNSREAGGYPTSSSYLSLNPYTTSLGYSDAAGLGGYGIDISASGSHYITGTLQGIGNGTIAIAEFRNISAGSGAQSTSSSNNGNGNSAYIGEIYIQY